MSETKRHSICNVDIPCEICVVDDCEHKKTVNVFGCPYGKPSNTMIKWAFEFTNSLRSVGTGKGDGNE